MSPPSALTSNLQLSGKAGYSQARFFVGPPWRKTTDTDFWDWTALTLTAYTPAAATTVATTVAFGATSIVLTAATTWPTSGGVWLGPNATGEAWGYATYTGRTGSTLTGCTRDTVDTEYTGVHTAGAAAHYWFPVTMETGKFTLRDSMDGNLSTSSWEVDFAGVNAPIGVLRSGHLVIVQARSIVANAWGDWTNFAIGWLTAVNAKDDEGKTREWTATVSSLAGMLANTNITGVHVGPRDIAEEANITASSTLEPVYKAIGNGNGEITATSENVTAATIVDGSLDTGWVSGRYYGEHNPLPAPAASAIDGITSSHGITQLHITKYTGQGDGYRWVEVSFFQDFDASDWLIAGWDYMVRFENPYPGGSLDYSSGDIIILAENPDLFNEENPENQAAAVLDLADWELYNMGNQKYSVSNDATGGTFTLTVDGQTTSAIAYNATATTVQAALVALSSVGVDDTRVTGTAQNLVVTFINALGQEFGPGMSGSGASLTGGTLTVTETSAPVFPYTTGSTGEAIFDYLSSAGGILRLYMGTTGQGQSQVVWGTGEPMTVWAPTWTGSALAAFGTAETARMDHNPVTPTVTANFWKVGRVATPGYVILNTAKSWLMFDLPEIGLTLVGDITNTVPGTGAALEMENPAGVSAEGLPATGTIQIGDEQMTYSARSFALGTVTILARGANGTVAAAHSLGDKVYFVNPALVATDAFPVKTINIKRPTTYPVPKDFIVYGSVLTLARTPDDTNYLLDYDVLATVTGNALTTYALDLSATNPRIRWLLVEFTVMSDPVSRMRVNEVDILVSGDVLNSTTNIESGTVAEVIDAIISQAELPSGAIVDAADTISPSEYTTAGGSMWPILSDLASYTRTRIRGGWDSKLYVSLDPFWAGTPAADGAWGRNQVRGVSLNRSTGLNVGELEVEWRSLAEKATEIVAQPSPRLATGETSRIGPYIYADTTAATAGALKRFWQLRRPYDVTMELAFVGTSLATGEIYTLTWDYSGRTEIRDYMLGKLNVEFSDFSWASVVVGVQVTRNDAR